MLRLFRRKPPANDDRFGYAVVGTGHGAEKMCEALRDSPHVRVTAVVSRSEEKARRFARRYGIPVTCTYENFATLAENKAVDAVYLALPVALHRESTVRAAAAGKHVLCEKPMAATIADAEAMIAACAAATRLLMIAYRLDYDPMHTEAARLLAEGALGAVTRVTSDFGIVAKTGWRFDPAIAGGGSLFDVGVYPIHALRNFFGDVTLKATRIERDPKTGMEMAATWSGILPNGAAFTCRSSYLERIADTVRIEGTAGWLELENAFNYSRTKLRAEYGETRLAKEDSKRNPSLFRLEAEHLALCARTGTPLRSPGEAGVRDLQTVAQIAK